MQGLTRACPYCKAHNSAVNKTAGVPPAGMLSQHAPAVCMQAGPGPALLATSAASAPPHAPEARRQLEEGQCAMPSARSANCRFSASSNITQWANQQSSRSHPTCLHGGATEGGIASLERLAELARRVDRRTSDSSRLSLSSQQRKAAGTQVGARGASWAPPGHQPHTSQAAAALPASRPPLLTPQLACSCSHLR